MFMSANIRGNMAITKALVKTHETENKSRNKIIQQE